VFKVCLLGHFQHTIPCFRYLVVTTTTAKLKKYEYNASFRYLTRYCNRVHFAFVSQCAWRGLGLADGGAADELDDVTDLAPLVLGAPAGAAGGRERTPAGGRHRAPARQRRAGAHP